MRVAKDSKSQKRNLTLPGSLLKFQLMLNHKLSNKSCREETIFSWLLCVWKVKGTKIQSRISNDWLKKVFILMTEI